MGSSLNVGPLFRGIRVGNEGRNSSLLAKLTITAKGLLHLTPKANPSTCTLGDVNVNAAGVLQYCSASNTWSSVGAIVGSADTLFMTPKANPATCTKGAINFNTDGKLYACSTTDTWTPQT